MKDKSVHWSESVPNYSNDQAESRVYVRSEEGWNDVPVQRYKPERGGWDGIDRHVLIGFREATGFHVRYFEIAPGGYSSLEQHDHAHAVTVVCGHGEVILGDRLIPLSPLDTVYVAPGTAHQFLNRTDQRFGFLCIVDAVRDRPRPIDPEQLRRILANPQSAQAVQTESADLKRTD